MLTTSRVAAELPESTKKCRNNRWRTKHLTKNLTFSAPSTQQKQRPAEPERSKTTPVPNLNSELDLQFNGWMEEEDGCLTLILSER